MHVAMHRLHEVAVHANSSYMQCPLCCRGVRWQHECLVALHRVESADSSSFATAAISSLLLMNDYHDIPRCTFIDCLHQQIPHLWSRCVASRIRFAPWSCNKKFIGVTRSGRGPCHLRWGCSERWRTALATGSSACYFLCPCAGWDR